MKSFPPSQIDAETLAYRRPFARSLATAGGDWSVREGVLLRCHDVRAGVCGFGEVAPLNRDVLNKTGSLRMETDLPEVAFARWSAMEAGPNPDPEISIPTAGLLSLGRKTTERLAADRGRGFRTWKVKLGTDTPPAEWKLLQDLVIGLRDGEKLRLDANRGWSEEDWKFWKPRLIGLSRWIEYLEEPFAQSHTAASLLKQAEQAPVPLALDESLQAGSLDEWININWPGFYIIKPSLFGHPERWVRQLRPVSDRVILSSVFETGIGLSAILQLAGEFPARDHGLGTVSYFEDGLGVHVDGNRLRPLSEKEKELVWNAFCKN